MKGHRIFLITGAPDIYVKHLSNFLGFDGYICTQLFYFKNKFKCRLDGDDIMDSFKVKEIRKQLDFSNLDNNYKTYAYSDNISDLPLLEFATFPMVINPEKLLLKIAKYNRWPIYKRLFRNS